MRELFGVAGAILLGVVIGREYWPATAPAVGPTMPDSKAVEGGRVPRQFEPYKQPSRQQPTGCGGACQSQQVWPPGSPSY